MIINCYGAPIESDGFAGPQRAAGDSKFLDEIHGDIAFLLGAFLDLGELNFIFGRRLCIIGICERGEIFRYRIIHASKNSLGR